MTNRDYVNTWSNEKLARAIGSTREICGEMQGCDPNLNCVQCCLKWLERERTMLPSKGDVRKSAIGADYYMVVNVGKENSKIMHSNGSFCWLKNSAVLTDNIADMTTDEFLKMVFENM